MVKLLNKWCFTPLFSLLLFPGIDMARSISPGKPHPVHIATVEIEHNATEKTLEITCKTFWDDFESVLSKNSKTRIDLTNDKNTAANNTRVFEYVKTHLQITVDGKTYPLSFVGYEKEDVVIYSYLQADNVASAKDVKVVTSLMHDMFDDQTEIVHVIVNGKRQSKKLDYPETTANFSF